MAQLAPRPSFAAALSVWRSHLFCHQRALTFLQQPRIRKFHSIPPPILSNEKLPFRIGFGAVPVVPRRIFCVRAATGVSDSGAVDSNLIQSMEKKSGFSSFQVFRSVFQQIKEHLTAESVIVTDAYGDGRHVSIDVISTAFEGQSAVNRQRMVYKAIWEELQNTVHAVDQMTTRTPAEAAATK